MTAAATIGRVIACPVCEEIVHVEANVVRTRACLYLDCPACGVISLIGRRP